MHCPHTPHFLDRRGPLGQPTDAMYSSGGGLKPRCLAIDLETSREAPYRIHKIAAWRPDTGEELLLQGQADLAGAATALDRMAGGAAFVLGHNVLAHDLPVLRHVLGELALDRLPVLDTLHLSPIAFPQNPYHRLLKDYKLVSDSRSDPLRDCRLSLQLFQDEHDALLELGKASPEELACHHFLLAGGAQGGLDSFFMKLRRAAFPAVDEVRRDLAGLLAPKVCSTRLTRLLAYDLTQPALRMPLAYALAWLRVAGGNSVLPPWVALQFPETRRLICELRDTPCGDPVCGYCAEQHDPLRELHRHFGLTSFRAEPAAPDGGSLQEAIVRAGMRGEHLLAILPTGAGKSLCYQLPALSRFWRTGQLTVIISPLQSLMKDQVDGLVRQGIFSAAALNGLLSMPERRDVLDRIRLGDIGILLVSPEQLRSRGFVDAIRYRDVAAWVFDEAHCLSKWGHDFRTDYLYAARFIRERHPDELPQIACFTATAKLDVIADLEAHFAEVLGIELRRFSGGHERVNLHFEVLPVRKQDKLVHIQHLLAETLGDQDGGAIVFTARRKSAEMIAGFLRANGWACSHFHAGLTPEVKKHVQNAFIDGDLRVIVATNAFGMGVDKPDVRLVVHAEIPGSLENYLQEAGRAGRDRRDARCVLLYDEEDVELQFGMSSRSRLTQKDIAEILKLLRRRAGRSAEREVVITSGEILADEELDVSIETENPDADTKVRTAIAWLERARFLRRDENHTRVFPSSLRVRTLDEARERLRRANLSAETNQKYLAVVELLMGVEPNEGVSTDELMQQTGIPSEECIRVLNALEQLGVLSNDLQISAYVRKGIARSSHKRLEWVTALESALLAALPEQAPDAEEEGWLDLNPRLLCQQLRERVGPEVLPDDVLRHLRALGQPFGEAGAQRSCLAVRKRSRDHYRVRLHCSWADLREHAQRRSAAAASLLDYLSGKIPPGVAGADLLVEAKAGELCQALRADLALIGRLQDEAQAVQQALLYLDSLGVLVLERGRAVFRAAMTLRLLPEEARRRFAKTDFAPLMQHYRERNFQIHVVQEYARRALGKLADALGFVTAYFTWPKSRFVREFFAERKALLERATTAESYRRIVEDLRHPVQQRLVADESDANRLVLAGPGSGKTRVIVHRAAFLLRVLRVPSDSIIVLTFNRAAAYEVRRRLYDLVGRDAAGVVVMTYHAMALRLTGTSLAGLAEADAVPDFDAILAQAVELLEGRSQIGDEADELRDRLLRGYRYILVDEYQDIDELQYRLVAALAGRTRADRDAKLMLRAVGDDDQNIYAFRRADVEFIRRFQQDYDAQVEFLVENYRSTAHIIDCANQVIARAPERLKAKHPIRVNHARRADPPGGAWSKRDPLLQGRVHIVSCPADPNVQAQLAVAEIERLRSLDPTFDWSDVAVLARTHRALAPLRAWCEGNGVAYTLCDPQAAAGQPRLWHTREGQRLVRLLRTRRTGLVRVQALERWWGRAFGRGGMNLWSEQLVALIDDLAADSATGVLPAQLVLESLSEAGHESRPLARGRLTLSTVHGAKGREYRHVLLLDGGWSRQALDEERRLYYVGMTRARETLTLFELIGRPNPFSPLLEAGPSIHRSPRVRFPPYDPTLDRQFVTLGMHDVDIGFPGRVVRPRVREAIRELAVGMPLRLRAGGQVRELLNERGEVVGRLAKACALPEGEIEGVRVSAIVHRSREQMGDPRYKAMCKVDEWEVVLCTLCLVPAVQAEPRRAERVSTAS